MILQTFSRQKNFEKIRFRARTHFDLLMPILGESALKRRDVLKFCLEVETAKVKFANVGLTTGLLSLISVYASGLFLFNAKLTTFTVPDMFGVAYTLGMLLYLINFLRVVRKIARKNFGGSLWRIAWPCLVLGGIGLAFMAYPSAQWIDIDYIELAPIPTQVAYGLFTVSLIGIFSTGFLYLAVLLIGSLQNWLLVHRAPIETLFDELARLLVSMQGRTFRSRELDIRRNQLRSLDLISSCLSRGLAARLATGGPGDEAVRERLLKSASAFESYKVWIAIPKPDTLERLGPIIRQSLIGLVLGAFDEFPQGALGQRRQGRLGRILASLRTIAVACLPGIAVIIAFRLGLPLSGEQYSWVVAGSIIWAVVYFASLLDPYLSSRVAVFKDLFSVLRNK